VDLASKLCGVEIEIRKHSEYEQELKEKELAKVRIEDIKDLKAAMRKTMVEKGYSNVLAVLKAPVEELKFLLKLDDKGVTNILDTLHNAKQVAEQIEELEKTAQAKAATEEKKARLEQGKDAKEVLEPEVKQGEAEKEKTVTEAKPKKSVTKKKKTKAKKTKKTKSKAKQAGTDEAKTEPEKEKIQEEDESTDELEVEKEESDDAEEKGT